MWVIETKGLEDVDVEPKRKRLQQWVKDVNSQQDKITTHELFVNDAKFKEYRPKDFSELTAVFKDSDF